MLFCTSLIALVGAADQPQSSPRKLQIVNTKVCPATYVIQVRCVCELPGVQFGLITGTITRSERLGGSSIVSDGHL